MTKLIAIAGLALAFATSAHAMTRAPLQPGSIVTQVREGCGPGEVRRAGICVARTDIRHERRCLRWTGSTCAQWQ
jgi:hypothetical protein